MRKSRRQVRYGDLTVVENSEHKSRRPRKQTRKGDARQGNGRDKSMLFDKKAS